MQRALINFFLDCNTRAGYLEVEPPVMVNEASGFGTGQLPDKEGQMYHATADNFYLVPTAEVPVTNIYRDVILDEKDFPVKMTAYTPCFRREAGSYGKDVRGLNRLHQFDKVEIVQLSLPEKQLRGAGRDGGPRRKHRQGTGAALPHPPTLRRRHVLHLGADLRFRGIFRSAETLARSVVRVEFRVVPGQPPETPLQAMPTKRSRLAHTLNGSSLALPRIVAALLENNQTPDGIRIPEALIPYTGFDMIK